MKNTVANCVVGASGYHFTSPLNPLLFMKKSTKWYFFFIIIKISNISQFVTRILLNPYKLRLLVKQRSACRLT